MGLLWVSLLVLLSAGTNVSPGQRVVTKLAASSNLKGRAPLQGTIQLTRDKRDQSLWSPPFRGNCQRGADPPHARGSGGCS